MIDRPGLVCVLDDDPEIRGSLRSLLRFEGYDVLDFASPHEFLASDKITAADCLLLDVRLGSDNGLDFQDELIRKGHGIPVILMTGHGDIPMSVRAMKAGAVDFLPKPFSEGELLAAVATAVERAAESRAENGAQEAWRTAYQSLSTREREVMALVTAGLMNKQVAGRLNLSEITVKTHRGNMMRKMQAQSLADLVRIAEGLGVRETSVTRYPAPARELDA